MESAESSVLILTSVPTVRVCSPIEGKIAPSSIERALRPSLAQQAGPSQDAPRDLDLNSQRPIPVRWKGRYHRHEPADPYRPLPHVEGGIRYRPVLLPLIATGPARANQTLAITSFSTASDIRRTSSSPRRAGCGFAYFSLALAAKSALHLHLHRVCITWALHCMA